MSNFLNQDKFLDNYFQELNLLNYDLGKKLAKEIKNSESKSDIIGYSSVLSCFNLIHQDINYIRDNSFVTDGGNDKSFDALYIDSKNKTLDIFDVKTNGGAFGDNALNDLKSYVERYLIKRDTLFDGNDRLKLQMPKIYHFIDENPNKIKIRFLIFKGEDNIHSEYRKTKDEICELLEFRYKGIQIDFYEIGKTKRNELITKMLYNLNSKDFKFLSGISEHKYNLEIINSLPEIDGTKVIVTNLYSLLKFIHLARKELSLYKMNVRDYKTDKSKNVTFEESVLRESNNFIKYHNGITIVCNKYNDKLKGDSIEIYDPQIVNGQQSVERLYDLFYKDLDLFDDFIKNDSEINLEGIKKVLGLKESKVIIKIINNCIDGHTNNLILTEKISEYTNDQRKIEKHELRNNDIINLVVNKILINNSINVKYPEYIQLGYACLYFDVKGSKNDKNKIFSINENNIYSNIINLLSLNNIKNICYWKQKIDEFDFSKINGIKVDDIKSFQDLASYYIVVGLNSLNNKNNLNDLNSNIIKLGTTLYKLFDDSPSTDLRKYLQNEGADVINEFLLEIEKEYNLAFLKYNFGFYQEGGKISEFIENFIKNNILDIKYTDFIKLIESLSFEIDVDIKDELFITSKYPLIENVQDYNALLVDEIKNNYILKDIQTSTFKELILKITKIGEIYHINEIVSLIIKELKNKKVKINSTGKTPIKTISSTITRDSKNEFSMKGNYKFERIK